MSAPLDATERAALEAFERGLAVARWDGRDQADWVDFGLRCLLEAGRVLRANSLGFHGRVHVKEDGSPATRLEREVERGVRERLAAFAPDAAFLGEESGGERPGAGFAVAVDPVDGTHAFLSETATWACVISVLLDGQPFAGFVANPATGEIAYALRGGRARLVRLPVFGEPASAHTLPTRAQADGPLLVCLHPHRGTDALRAALHAAWQRDELRLVRSPGGSPTWGLAEAARGHHVYLNAWSREPAQPFDLVAGTLLVRSAGGEVVDADGAPIDATCHAGPWIAGVHAAQRARVAALVRGAWPDAAGGAQ
ncbi:MAG: hypothetical protein NTY35_06285 [Planctomycetota bacterium]|nr:hypothetical protein [Planctomycetota bacterium]